MTMTWTSGASGIGAYADVNGINLYYETHGSGRPLILLHGGLGTGEMFGPILPTLAERRQVVLVEQVAGAVELDHQDLVAGPLRGPQRAGDEVGLDGVDAPAHGDDVDGPGGRRRLGGRRRGGDEHRAEHEEGDG